MIKTVFYVALAIVFGWPIYGHCEEPPRLRFDWSASYDTHFSQKTRDGGYIISGQFWEPGGNQYDFWVLKLDQNGNIEWQKTYGGGSWDIAFSTQQTTDGGYIVSGTTSSFGDGLRDIWVLRLSPDGNIIWDKTYGGKGEESEYFRHIPIEPTSDGGYIVAGSTRSFGAGEDDFWILKLNADGDITWQKTFGTGREEYPTSIREMQDGTYRVTGTESLSVSGDDWILILDAKGNIAGVRSKINSGFTFYDTMVVPKPTNEKTSNSSALVGDSSQHMEKNEMNESTTNIVEPRTE